MGLEENMLGINKHNSATGKYLFFHFQATHELYDLILFQF
jgi:hypothetical protein